MSFEFRPATAADFEFARKAHHAAYREVVERQFGPWDEAVQDRFFEQNWGKNFEILFSEDVARGYVGIESQPGEFWLRELVILPEFQGKGLGTAVLRRMQENAAAQNIPIRLQVLKANRAQQLYSRLGFRVSGSTGTHVQMEWRSENV